MAVSMSQVEDRGRTFGIKTLNPSNYLMWQFNIQTVLEEEDLWGFIDDSEVKPAETDATNYAKYNKRLKKCKRILILTMEEEVQKIIMRLDKPKEVGRNLLSKVTCQKNTDSA